MENEQSLRPYKTIARIILKDYVDRITPDKYERIVQEVDRLMSLLPENQKLVIEYSFGFKGKKYELHHISKRLSMKISEISKLKNDAINWISHPNHSFGLYMALTDDVCSFSD